MVRLEGFEPPTTAFEAQYSIQLSYSRKFIEYARLYENPAAGYFFVYALLNQAAS